MAKNDRKPGYMLYFDTINPVLKFLPLEDRGLLLTWITEYADLKTVPPEEGSKIAMLAFEMIRSELDRDEKRYYEKSLKAAHSASKKSRVGKELDFEEWLSLDETQERYRDFIEKSGHTLKTRDRYRSQPIETERYQTIANGANNNTNHSINLNTSANLDTSINSTRIKNNSFQKQGEGQEEGAGGEREDPENDDTDFEGKREVAIKKLASMKK